MNNLCLDNQPRCTNLRTLSFSDAGFCLTPKEHLLFLSNILTLILHNPNINTLHIPVDLLAFCPGLFLDILQLHLPQLERLELGQMTSKGYSYTPSSASDYADLGLVRNNNDNANVIKVAQFSGKVDWETTVQLLETCLWNRQKNKTNAFLTHLRCLYYITGNMNHIPTSTIQSQFDRVCYPSSSSSFSSVNDTTATSSSSPPTSSAHYEEKGDDLEEPRLKVLILPRWGGHGSEYSIIDEIYLDSFIIPLVDQLPYLAQFYPRSGRHKRFLEDEFDDVVAAADIEINPTERVDYTISSRGRRGRRGFSSGREGEGMENKVGVRYRWRIEPEPLCPCSEC
ncbi:hypothetical protein BGZ96_011517 [Linnemannia gamsii]|uniref:Uncharacterized protein n=1 Tax=Linnemannia gamsii TaxID=64522 RepID=A0ABQ7JTS1_9FUNG|nr:hypothetical protein BGZ96_011517 [Linnemannia gamsii]